MSDERELTAEQEDHVRRLLAEARAVEPMPDDVVGRLDRVLARLADGEDGDAPATVVELAHRRRRKLTTLLVAAAAVVVVGVGAGQLFPRGHADSTADSAADSAADSTGGSTGGSATLDAPADADALTAPEAAPAPEAELSGKDALMFLGPQRVRPQSFAADVARLRRAALMSTTRASDGAAAADGPQSYETSTDARDSFICAAAPWGPGDLYAVTYDGKPAVLAFRRPMGESQVVDLLECGSATILRSVTLPAR